jgi:hypothetical protein
MRCMFCCLVMFLVPVAALHSQQRPTLGPSEPSMRGPGTSQTANPGMLVRMRKIYIQRIDNNLNERLTDDLAHASWVKVVDKPDEADAIVRGTCFSLRHLKRLHAEVYITDRVSGKSIWQDVIRVPCDPPALPKAVDDAAAEILAHLNQSIRAAANPHRGRY